MITENGKKDKEINSQKETIDNLTNENNEKDDGVRKLLNKLGIQFPASGGAGDPPLDPIQVLGEEIDKLKQENNDLNDQVKQKAEEIKKDKNQINVMNQENDKLKADIESLKQSIKEKDDKILLLTRQNQVLQAKIAELQNFIEELLQENKRLNKENEMLKQRIEFLTQQIDMLNLTLTKKQNEINELGRERQELQTQLATIEREKDEAMEKQMKINQDLLDSYKQHNDELEEKIKELNNARDVNIQTLSGDGNTLPSPTIPRKQKIEAQKPHPSNNIVFNDKDGQQQLFVSASNERREKLTAMQTFLVVLATLTILPQILCLLITGKSVGSYLLQKNKEKQAELQQNLNNTTYTPQIEDKKTPDLKVPPVNNVDNNRAVKVNDETQSHINNNYGREAINLENINRIKENNYTNGL